MFSLKNQLVANALLLTAANFFCRGIGFIYRIFVSQTYGAEAMGVIQLVTPILALAYAISCSGFQTAISRMAAIKKDNSNQSFYALFVGGGFSFILATVISFFIYVNADYFAINLLLEHRTAPLLRILCLSFPFSSLHACINGYFYGINKASIPAFLQCIEQLIRVSTIMLISQWYLNNQVLLPLSIIAVGTAISEFCITLISFLFIFSKKVKIQTTFCLNDLLYITKPLYAMVIPLSLSRIIVTVLQSIENIYIPEMLRQYGYNTSEALSLFGTLTGMALSIIFLPCSLVNSIAILLLPKVAKSQSLGKNKEIDNTIKKTLQFCILFGLLCLLFFFFFGKQIGILLFHNKTAGEYIYGLSFICPFLYITSALGAILHGLGKNYTTLFINITALTIRIVFIFFAIPRIGISGYLCGLLVSQAFSALSCIYSLKKNDPPI